MRLLLVVLLVVLLVPSATSHAQAVTRRGLLHTGIAEGQYSDEQEFGSMVSLGTMFGLSFTAHDPSTYKIDNSIVVFDEERQRLLPAVFALPSIALIGRPGRSLSAIVPVNLNTAGETNFGLGLSYGFNIRKTAELGLSVVAVWSNHHELTPEQRRSLDNRTPLASDAITGIRTVRKPSLNVGIFLVPIL